MRTPAAVVRVVCVEVAWGVVSVVGVVRAWVCRTGYVFYLLYVLCVGMDCMCRGCYVL